MKHWNFSCLNDSAPTPRRSNCTSELFEDFVQKSLNQTADGNDCHFLPQVYYVFENGDYQQGKRLSRHILHLKRLKSEFPALMARYSSQHVRLGAPQHPGWKCHLIFLGAVVFVGGFVLDLVHEKSSQSPWVFQRI